MLPYPNINPEIVRIGPLALRWYGLMYLAGFLASWALVRYQVKESVSNPDRRRQELAAADSLLTVLVLGVVLGGRLGYVVFYNPLYFLRNPSEILATWHGGMSFHGGLAGALAAGFLYCRKTGDSFLKWTDRFVVTAPIGLGLGRIGNFINGELFGRPSNVPWAMIFPQGGMIPRHPSQLYEMFAEGPLLFLLLWAVRRRPWPMGARLAVFLTSYGICRFLLEFFREPDPQLGFLLWGWVTMGQILSAGMAALGMTLWFVLAKKQTPATAESS